MALSADDSGVTAPTEYRNWPLVLLRLAQVDGERLAELIPCARPLAFTGGAECSQRADDDT